MDAAEKWFDSEPHHIHVEDDSRGAHRQNLLDVAQKCGAKRIASSLRTHDVLGEFLTACSTLSPFIRSTLLRHVGDLELVFDSSVQKHIVQLTNDARCLVQSNPEISEREIKERLRIIKTQAHLLIGLCDIAQSQDVIQTTKLMSELAEACICAAVDWLLLDLHRSGKIALSDERTPAKNSRLIVLGMGKLGAFELNYSSDIDLIIFFDQQTDSLTFSAQVDPTETMSRLARRLVSILQEHTGEGYVFRTDLRLRPDPSATPLAINRDSALIYYESRGQNWERAAFIKARPVAGDLAAGANFLAELKPFIWRKYLDYAAIADVQSIKRQIHAHKGHNAIAVNGHNVKLGRGGIREIEFFVQTQQLIAAGRAPDLRHAQTLEMLGRLADAGWVEPFVRDELTQAYKFLRRVEHTLQIINDQQTHTLPNDDDGLLVIAQLLGISELQSFKDQLLQHLRKVEAHFGNLFQQGEALTSSSGNLVFTGEQPDPDTLTSISTMGYKRPSDMWSIVRSWHYGRYSALQSESARAQLTELVPHLLEGFAQSESADEALVRFDAFLAGLTAGLQPISMLNNNRHMLSLIITILSAAPRLADIITARPSVFYGVLDPAFFDQLPGEEELQEQLSKFLLDAHDYEEKLDRLRLFAAEHKFLAGVRFLTGSISAQDLGLALSQLADVLLKHALDAACGEVEKRHGQIEQSSMCLVAMGRLGSCEMTAGSDVDLMLVYDAPASQHSNGDKSLDPQQYFARITQRLIAALTAPMAQGILYEVDFRLRPSGNKGPLATSFDAFSKYQREAAWTWEHMALTRARAVCGDDELMKRVEGERISIIKVARDIESTKQDIADMRARLLSEKPARSVWDLKRVSGGITDIEFLAQYWALTRLPNCNNDLQNCKLIERSADHILALLDETTLSLKNKQVLVSALNDFTTVNHLVRLCVDGDFNPDRATQGLKEQLCAAMHVPDLTVLEEHLKAQQHQVARVFGSIIAS